MTGNATRAGWVRCGMPHKPSVQDFLRARDELPTCYALVMNSIWDRMEARTLVALFDTEEMAVAYEAWARLPKAETTEAPDGWGGTRTMFHHYRTESLLRNFNPPHEFDAARGQPHVIVAPVDFDYRGTPINPEIAP